MITKFKTRLLEIDKKHPNGNIYTKECIENALKELNNKPLLVTANIESVRENGLTLNNAIGGVDNLKIEENYLVGDVGLFSELIQKCIDDNVNIRPIGTGNIKENGEITDYKLLGVTIILNG